MRPQNGDKVRRIRLEQGIKVNFNIIRAAESEFVIIFQVKLCLRWDKILHVSK